MSTAEELSAAYARIRPNYLRLSEELARILKASFRRSGLEASVEWRAKDVDSFVEKALDPEKGYQDPIAEISDLAGIRVVARSADLLPLVKDVVAAEFEVDDQRSVDKIETLEEDRFGYLSTHYIVRLKPPRSGQVEYLELTGLWAEIQVRTVSQHAWAQLSRFLLYKSAADVPRPLRRRVYALAGLFEVADREIQSLVVEASGIVNGSRADIQTDAAAVPIEVESLTAYLQSSPTIQALKDIVGRIGVKVGGIGLISRDVEMLRRADVLTVADLDRLLREALPWAEDYLRLFYQNTLRSHGIEEPSADDLGRMTTDVNGLVPLFLIASFPYVFSADVLESQFAWGRPERALDAAAQVRARARP